ERGTYQLGTVLGAALVAMIASFPLIAAAEGTARPTLVVTPGTDMTFSRSSGGLFSPASFDYRIGSSTGTIRYAINPPFWLTVTPRIGTVGAQAMPVTLTVNMRAQRLPPGTYKVPVTFTNLTNGQGTTTRNATLVIAAPASGGYLLDDGG